VNRVCLLALMLLAYIKGLFHIKENMETVPCIILTRYGGHRDSVPLQ
jgi:hypothetical protein